MGQCWPHHCLVGKGRALASSPGFPQSAIGKPSDIVWSTKDKYSGIPLQKYCCRLRHQRTITATITTRRQMHITRQTINFVHLPSSFSSQLPANGYNTLLNPVIHWHWLYLLGDGDSFSSCIHVQFFGNPPCMWKG